MDRHDNERIHCFKLFYGSCVPGIQHRRDGLFALDTGALRDHVLEEPWFEGGPVPEGGPHGVEDVLPAPRRLPGRPPRSAGDLTVHESLGCSLLPHVGRCGAHGGAMSHAGASVPQWDTMGHTGVETRDSVRCHR